MTNNFCPNYSNCQIIHVEQFVTDPFKRSFYITAYCEAGDFGWIACKRYQTKKALNMCADFILPDTTLTIDEIIIKLEE